MSRLSIAMRQSPCPALVHEPERGFLLPHVGAARR
jgi:hypothetical protein